MPVERTEIGPCTLYCGDCLELLAAGEIPAGAAIVSDPPYGIGFERSAGGLSSWAKSIPTMHICRGEASRIKGDESPFDPSPWLHHSEKTARRAGNSRQIGGGRIALCGADAFAQRLPATGAWYCWDKSCGGGPADSFTDAEFIWMSARNARRVYRHQWKGRLRQDDPGARLPDWDALTQSQPEYVFNQEVQW